MSEQAHSPAVEAEPGYSEVFKKAIDSVLEDHSDFVIQGSYANNDVSVLHLAGDKNPQKHSIAYRAATDTPYSRVLYGLIIPVVLPDTRRNRYTYGEDDVEIIRQYQHSDRYMIGIRETGHPAGEVRKRLFDKNPLKGDMPVSDIALRTASDLEVDIKTIKDMQPVKLRALSHAFKRAVIL